MLKSEELVLFRKLVEALPDGYVRDILTESEPFIADSIRLDIGTHAPVSGIIGARLEAAKDLEEVQNRITQETARLQAVRQELANYTRRLDEIKTEIRSLARGV